PDPTPLNNTTGDTICVVNSTQCLDLENNDFTWGNPIIFLSVNATEERFRWHLAQQDTVTYNAATGMGSPFSDGSLDQYYNGDPIYYIEKSIPTGHDGCMGTRFAQQVTWETCIDPRSGTLWIRHNKYFVNVDLTEHRLGKWVMSKDQTDTCHDGDFDPV